MVAGRDRLRALARTLPLHPRPVILVDDGSADGTAGFVRRHFTDVHLIETGTSLGAPARNLGVQAAETPYVAFADDDSWWAPGALERAADLLDAHPRLAVLGARVLVGPEERLDAASAEMRDFPLGAESDLPGPSVLGFLTCGAVVRRDAFLEAGGFDDVVSCFGEDERLAVDLAGQGWGLAYVDDVVAHHHPSPSAGRHDRRALATRNGLLTAVLRRPWQVVARRAFAALRSGPEGWRGLGAAVRRLPRALAERRPVPPQVEERLSGLESRRSRGRPEDRRYTP
ncbi:glycosyltransferase [Nonomuraea zeae]|uniref:Glycosyltransferase n=1 Tax=Nonomuraea zeae TaxID=1642303 RepID=A0A5S4GDE7_9ACTN|nr:glycosyltransferase [Nonomuraea zeae]